jgi:hypothetical protein
MARSARFFVGKRAMLTIGRHHGISIARRWKECDSSDDSGCEDEKNQVRLAER